MENITQDLEDFTDCHWFSMQRSMPSPSVFKRSTPQSLKGCIIKNK